MRSYTPNRKQFASVEDHVSSLANTVSDVPQLSILGLFMNDLSDSIGDDCRFFAYADDVVLLYSCDRSYSYTFGTMINEPRSTYQLMDDRENVSLFNSPRAGSSNLFIRLKGNTIDLVMSMSCFSVILDRKINFPRHMDSISAKICLAIRKLYNFNLHLAVQVKYSIAHALLISHVN